MKFCIKCGSVVTHHHKYCDDCYPNKSATILTLKNTNIKYRNLILKILNHSNANPKKVISKKSIKILIKKNNIKDNKINIALKN